MSKMLSAAQDAFQQALDTLRELSANAPGTVTTQTLCVGAVVGLVSYFLLRKRYRLPPGPFALPLAGNILDMTRNKDPYYMVLSRLREKYGPVIMIYLGPVPCVVLNRVDVVMEALVKKGADFSGRPQFYSMQLMTGGFKDILFADDSAAWKIHRKLAVQALRHYMSGAHLETVVQHVVSKTVKKMLAEPGAFDPHMLNMMTMFVMLDMFCFGGSKDFDEPKLVALRDVFDRITKEFGNGFLEDVFPPLRYFPTKKFRSFKSGMEVFLAYICEQIDEHRKKFSPSNVSDITDSILLAQVQAEQEQGSESLRFFTNTHVAHTILDLFAGGIDTSRITLDWGIYFLASFPEVQKRMQEELDEVTGDRLPGLADRRKLPYTEAVFHEIMRKGNAVPTGIPHKTAVDTTVGGYDVPKDMMVMVNHWALLHDPEQWDNPDEFRPERFLDNKGELISRPDSWLPFSAGRRSCLGESVAKPELLLIFSIIAKRLTLTLAPGFTYDPAPDGNGLLLHLPKPYKIIAKERSPSNI